MLVNLSYKMSTLNAGTGTQQRLCVLTFLGSHYGTLESQICLSFDDLTPIRLIFWNFYFVQQTLATALPPPIAIFGNGLSSYFNEFSNPLNLNIIKHPSIYLVKIILGFFRKKAASTMSLGYEGPSRYPLESQSPTNDLAFSDLMALSFKDIVR